jgi:hypothetical protein
MISPQRIMVRASSFVLQGGGFNTDASTYTSPSDIKGVVKKLRNGKAMLLMTSC